MYSSAVQAAWNDTINAVKMRNHFIAGCSNRSFIVAPLERASLLFITSIGHRGKSGIIILAFNLFFLCFALALKEIR